MLKLGPVFSTNQFSTRLSEDYHIGRRDIMRSHILRVRFLVLIELGLIAGAFTWYLANFYLISIRDEVAKATIAAGAITLFGVIFSAIHNEISAYYEERSAYPHYYGKKHKRNLPENPLSFRGSQ